MKKLALSVIVLAGLALLASCKKDNDSINSTFKASIEQQNQNGKTAIDTTNGHITWNAGDEILISNGSDSETFTLQTGEGTTNGTFSTAGALAMTGNYTAAYPATASIDGTTVTFSLPATQTMANGESGTFANGANPMVAVANGTTNLAFKNPCGGLGIRLKGATEGITVTNIRIIGGSDDILWGNLTVTMDGGDVATTSIANTATGKNIIDLTCNVTLSTTEAKRFFIVLPEGALQHGFTLEVSYGAAEPYSKSTGDTDIAQVQRNTMKSLNAITIGAVAPVVTLPAVTTTDVTSITTNSAVSGGENIDNGGGTISEYGICWSETANPTIENDTLHHLGEPLMTDYSFTMTGLDENTTYHVRAYVTNEAGTAYGEDKEFSTAAYVAPTVTTGTVAATSATAATGHVTLTNAGNIGDVTEIGLCWGTENDPVVGTSNHAAASAHEVGTAYEVSFDDLTALTTYYVRAYAMVGTDYYYGSSVSFMVTWNGDLAALTGSEPVDFATATNGMTIYGTLNAKVKVSIADGATVTLNNATISYSSNGADYAGLTLIGDGTLVLADGTTNTVESGLDGTGNNNWPGIYVPQNKTLTIDGNTGILNARCGQDGYGGSTAGIGCGFGTGKDCGNITINGGVIYANGGAKSAGIGGAYKRSCGNITINGGIVTATGGSWGWGAGIGTGGNHLGSGTITCGDITITGGTVIATGGEDAAGIGTGSSDAQIAITCGKITISGGEVTATGGEWGAGIGTGFKYSTGTEVNQCGDITITNGVISVTATKGNYAANSIGKGNPNTTCGTITIGGTVYPDGATPNHSDGKTFVYPLPEGAINGLFSVSTTKQVYFSQGNLWATTSDLGSTWTWSFAENQYDYIGNATANNAINGNGTVSTNGSIDLFCWSTNASFYGINNSTDDYGYSGTFIEWGNIAISNGGNTENSGWRTLTVDEWSYLFNTRTDAASKRGLGTVNGVNGLIILPDVWILPEGLTFTAVFNSWANNYNSLQWVQMEANGAVFLPALGYRGTTGIVNVGSRGDYWSSSAGTNNANARSMYFQINTFKPTDTSYRRSGRGVRLVKDAE